MAHSKSPKQSNANTVQPYSIAKILEDVAGDPEIANVRLNHVAGALWLPGGLDPEARQARIDEMIMSIAELKPRDAAERMLITQMLALHYSAMECFRRAMIDGQSFEGRESNLKHGEKLTASFAKLLETLNKHRGKGQQKVTVKHVHVASGGQAIVGNVGSDSPAHPSRRTKVAPPQIAHHVEVDNSLEALGLLPETDDRDPGATDD